MTPDSPRSPRELLRVSTTALRCLLGFETALRESLIVRFSPTIDWWKSCVPATIRTEASERRRRDKASTFAPKWTYHQLYYCYLEDLKQIVQRAAHLLFESHPKASDLTPRFEELLVLRNRVAHGRLLNHKEADRVKVLVSELETLLRIDPEPKALSFEDPEALRSTAQTYFNDAI